MQSVISSLQSVVCSLRSAVCGLQSAVCRLQSAVCSLQSANVRHRYEAAYGSNNIYFELFDKYFDSFAVSFACNVTYIFGSVVTDSISLTVRLGCL